MKKYMETQTIPAGPITTKDALLTHLAQGDTVDYLFFWGLTANDPAQIGKECLCQWYPAGFDIDGVHYPTAEHYMMAEKARLFGDDAVLQKILAIDDPALAKQLGRIVKGYDDALWSEHRFEIVVRGNSAKFAQNEKLRAFLHSTGDRILVEASPDDKIWGIGMFENHPDARSPAKWRGMNLLGFALTDVRVNS
jgi:ribA/ribD-fused uncharacterized protein